MISGRDGPKQASRIVHKTAKENNFLYGSKYEINRLKMEIFIVAFSDIAANLPKFQGKMKLEINSFFY
jgi:hypothetical protein